MTLDRSGNRVIELLLFLVRILAELGQHGLGALGMQESYLQAVGAFARSLVDQAYSLLLALFQSVGHTVLNGECHMVHAAASSVFLNELGDCAVGARGFQELDLRVAGLEEGGGYLLVLYNFLFVAFQTQNFFIVLDSLCQIGHCYTDVFNV